MTDHVRRLSAVFLALLPVCWSSNGPAAAFAQAPPAVPDTALLKERDRLWEEAQKLRSEGKLAEAIKAGEAMLAIERKLFPAGDPDLAVSLGWLAEVHEEREDFAAAKSARREALSIVRARYGKLDWRTVDATLTLGYVERLSALSGVERVRLSEAARLNGTMMVLYRSGKYGDSLRLARRVLELREEVLGARDPKTTESLNSLAFLLESQGDSASAKPLYERALSIRESTLGPNHPNTAQSLNNLASLLQSQGDYAFAKPL